jgi:hypothetical protein
MVLVSGICSIFTFCKLPFKCISSSRHAEVVSLDEPHTHSLTLSPQIKRELPDKRIGGTIDQPHFDDAALEMLYTSLPARTTNALEYIAFQVTW